MEAYRFDPLPQNICNYQTQVVGTLQGGAYYENYSSWNQGCSPAIPAWAHHDVNLNFQNKS
jgi:hypothetical protein